MSYKAIVCKIKTFPHPNADKLQLGNAHGYQVVIGLNVENGQLGVYFPTDGQLSEEFAKANDLVARVDENGKKAGGYFDRKRRVRAQNFRNEKSEGCWCPLDSLAFTGYDVTKLEEGTQFDTLNNIPICNKYYTPATIKAMGGNQKKIRKNNKCFAKHMDTEQFFHEIDAIPPGSLIYLSEKLHGTSGRTAHVIEEKEVLLPWYKRWYNKVLNKPISITETAYKYLIGTRNIILDVNKGGFYGNETFRVNASKAFEGCLHKGEIVYYEIVGFTTSDRPIMQTQNLKVLKDKEFIKRYGEIMTYKYGCQQGTCDIYVYRIAMINEDGVLIDLPWARVKERCKIMGVKHVPEFNWTLEPGPSTHLCDPFYTGKPAKQEGSPNPYLYSGNKEELIKIVSLFMEGPSTVDQTHMREGVVVRIENKDGVSFLKAKNHTFGILEGYLKDSESYVDLEEIS